MKITRVSATASSTKRQTPIRDAIQWLDTQGYTRITVDTDDGVSGTSVTYFGRVEQAPDALAYYVNNVIAPAILGEDPVFIRGIRDKLWRLTDYHGTAGFALLAISGIDTALWDLAGRAANKPVWRLLGAYRDRVPTYAMVGWLNYTLDELSEICGKAMAQGFQGVKVKVGAPTLEEDVERIEVVRATIGDDALLMVDANQVFTFNEALRRGRVYEDLGCFWYEEPVRADDNDGLARLADALTIPIASGENNFGKRQFRDLFERRAVDIVQPDLRRAGGVTECLEIGAMADAFNVPYASHGGGVHLHVLAALPNALMLESGLLPPDSPVKLVDGCYPLPEAPGFGDLIF